MQHFYLFRYFILVPALAGFELSNSGSVDNCSTTVLPQLAGHLYVKKFSPLVPYSQDFISYLTYELTQLARVFRYTWLERLARDKHLSQGMLKGEVSLYH